MMCGGMFLVSSVLMAALILGFAQIIWVLSVKEAPITKLIGQAISIVIVVLTLVIIVVSATHGRNMIKAHCEMMGPMLQGKGSMEMMKSPEMKKMMMEKHQNTGKK